MLVVQRGEAIPADRDLVVAERKVRLNKVAIVARDDLVGVPDLRVCDGDDCAWDISAGGICGMTADGAVDGLRLRPCGDARGRGDQPGCQRGANEGTAKDGLDGHSYLLEI